MHLSKLAEMDALLEKHPFSHVVRIAHLNILKQHEEIRFEDELNKAAIHLPNRKVIHELAKAPVNNQHVQGQSQDTVQNEAIENTDSQLVEAEAVVPIDEEKKIFLELQKQYLTSAVQSSIALEVDEVGKEMLSQEVSIEEGKVEAINPSSFLEFITGDKSTESDSLGTVESSALIDSFLKSEKREKVAFFDPERMAKKSLDDKEGMVSDTLARIYVNQGNYTKAIDAYERLILKYPEKSGYFAARIQKIEDLKRLKK